MRYILSFDVEETSIELNTLDNKTAEYIADGLMGRLLDILSDFDIHAVFYFTGTFAENYPDCVREVHNRKHEIGCHGYDHNVVRSLDALSPEIQRNEINKATIIIRSIVPDMISFRAPALRINNETISILVDNGYKTDSPVSSRRFDFFLSSGSLRKFQWLNTPKLPYHPDIDNPFMAGDTSILEIPVTAIGIPYIGTTMRIHPGLFRLLQEIILKQSINEDLIPVFLFHPNECVRIYETHSTTKRANNYVSYLLTDLLRQRLKMRNLGEPAIKLFQSNIELLLKKEVTFVCPRDLIEI